jgi:hypothetical protein
VPAQTGAIAVARRLRLSDQLSFVSALKDVFKEDPTLQGEVARTKVVQRSSLKKNGRRNSFLWLSKMGFEDLNKDLAAEKIGQADIRDLMHNNPGQGKKTECDSAAEKRLTKWLTADPKYNSGVTQW